MTRDDSHVLGSLIADQLFGLFGFWFACKWMLFALMSHCYLKIFSFPVTGHYDGNLTKLVQNVLRAF